MALSAPSSPSPPWPFTPWRRGADLARAGVSRKFLYELESGKETLRADKVLAVLAALELRAGFMLLG